MGAKFRDERESRRGRWWSNGDGPLDALLRLLKLQEKGRQRPPPSHLRFTGIAIPTPLHYCTAFDHWSPPFRPPPWLVLRGTSTSAYTCAAPSSCFSTISLSR
nr:unnamed protein product [Digitaria exilis]